MACLLLGYGFAGFWAGVGGITFTNVYPRIPLEVLGISALAMGVVGVPLAIRRRQLGEFLVMFIGGLVFIGFAVALGLPLTWYGLTYVVGFVVGFYLLQRLRRDGLIPVGKEQMFTLVLWIVIAVMIGGRVGYYLLYRPQDLVAGGGISGLGDLFRGIVGPGRSFHGALIGVAVAVFLLGWKWRMHPLWLGDFICLTAAPGIFFGRLGNFVNQELWGRPAGESLPWGIRFYGEAQQLAQKDLHIAAARTLQTLRPDDPALAPLATKLAVPGPALELPVGLNVSQDVAIEALRLTVQEGTASPAGRETIIAELGNLIAGNRGLQSTLMESQRQYVLENVLPQVPFRHPSQIYQAVGEGLLVFVLLWVFRRRLIEHKGFLSGLFLAGYGVMRFFVEFFREADKYYNPVTRTSEPYYWAGLLSLGQLYCLPMVVGGIFICIYARRMTRLNPEDRVRLAWARSGDEETPPREVYPAGRAPAEVISLDQKIALYERRIAEKRYIEEDGKEAEPLTDRQIAQLGHVLAGLRAAQQAAAGVGARS